MAEYSEYVVTIWALMGFEFHIKEEKAGKWNCHG